MANIHTASTYRRQPREHQEKLIDSYLRANYGQSVSYEIVGDKVVVNNGTITSFDDLARKGLDFQTHLSERPELEGVIKSRMQRAEDSANNFSRNAIHASRSEEEMQQEQAQAYMKANSIISGYNKTEQATGLPSDRK